MHPIHNSYITLRLETMGFIPGLSRHDPLLSQKLITKLNEII